MTQSARVCPPEEPRDWLLCTLFSCVQDQTCSLRPPLLHCLKSFHQSESCCRGGGRGHSFRGEGPGFHGRLPDFCRSNCLIMWSSFFVSAGISAIFVFVVVKYFCLLLLAAMLIMWESWELFIFTTWTKSSQTRWPSSPSGSFPVDDEIKAQTNVMSGGGDSPTDEKEKRISVSS